VGGVADDAASEPLLTFPFLVGEARDGREGLGGMEGIDGRGGIEARCGREGPDEEDPEECREGFVREVI